MFRKKQEVWAIVHKQDQRVIGSIGVHRKSVNEIYELGYVLSEDYWGQGIVAEACEEVIRHVFEDMNIDMLYVEHFSENTQSKRVIEKLGFTFVELLRESFTIYNGDKKDCLKYKIEKEDYYAKTKRNL
jgi:RimJ/RimL family protein N-acetyltransferase